MLILSKTVCCHSVSYNFGNHLFLLIINQAIFYFHLSFLMIFVCTIDVFKIILKLSIYLILNQFNFLIDNSSNEPVAIKQNLQNNLSNIILHLLKILKTLVLKDRMRCKHIPQHRWSSGTIHRCHRCDPGSIPGRCTTFVFCFLIQIIIYNYPN